MLQEIGHGVPLKFVVIFWQKNVLKEILRKSIFLSFFFQLYDLEVTLLEIHSKQI
jgi:hypothetical protein